MSAELTGLGYYSTQDEMNHQQDMFFAWPGDNFSFRTIKITIIIVYMELY